MKDNQNLVKKRIRTGSLLSNSDLMPLREGEDRKWKVSPSIPFFLLCQTLTGLSDPAPTGKSFYERKILVFPGTILTIWRNPS